MSVAAFRELFTDDRPVIFNFHGYPSAVHQLIHRRPRQERFHVRGYAEEGTTTTPFDLLAMNGVDRYQLAIEALSRADVGVSEFVARDVRRVRGAEHRWRPGGDRELLSSSSTSTAATCASSAMTRPRSRTGRGRDTEPVRRRDV